MAISHFIYAYFKEIHIHQKCIFTKYTFLCRWRDGQTGDGEGPLEGVKEQVLETIKRTFQVSTEQASQLCSELLQCTRKKHLVSTFSIRNKI